jgi:hypothetical protein
MPRTHGCAPVGERCPGKHGWRAKGRTNAVGALLAGCLLTARLLSGPVNADVVVMGNARFHKRQDIGQAIINAGHVLEYLPTHSPGLNPIGHKWARAKAVRRQYNCPVEEVFQRHNL